MTKLYHSQQFASKHSRVKWDNSRLFPD